MLKGVPDRMPAKARRAMGTKVETIRYYERIGLLPAPARTGANYCTYVAEHVGRLSFIRRARDLGFTLEQVRALLSLPTKRIAPARPSTASRAHLAEVDRKIADLRALRRELSTIIGQCGQGTIAHCRIIEALAPL
jgi:DNA-binding transcriptional MerR regulator